MTSNKILIYSSQNSNRLQYITSLIFTELLGIKFEITEKEEDFINSTAAKINYSKNPELPGFSISANTMLFETDIKKKVITRGHDWQNTPAISIDEQPFDVFAASFYLVSRYEEYAHYSPDIHNRFPAEESCLVQLGLIKKPLVNLWALQLQSVLKEQHPNLQFSPRKFEYMSTIDIDQAWKYKHKGIARNAGGLFRDLISGDMSSVKQRIQVITNKKEDPFYNFHWQNTLHKQNATRVQYFFQVGNRGKFDKNTPSSVEAFQSLIKDMDQKHQVGIHPSYQSNQNVGLVKNEIDTLQEILKRPIHTSRQHFLKIELPQTYQRLIDNGIEEEHSLGYTSHTGFRAGIAAPFTFFDLSTNKITELKCVPFALMDITSLHYTKQTSAEAIASNRELIQEVKSVGGLLASLWHNESLSEDGRWRDWRCVYESLIHDAAKAMSS